MSNNMVRSAAYGLGLLAEKRACALLRSKGYKILEQRYKTKHGEIDILALKDDMLVAVEVKARNKIEDALESITPRSRKRIERSLLHFVAVNPEYAAHGLRFDVVASDGDLKLQHIESAWICE